MTQSLGRFLALLICVIHITSCAVKVKKPKLSSLRNPASTAVENDESTASASSSSANDDEIVKAQAPVLSYVGAAGTIGIVNQPMSILPTTLNDSGSSITACGVKVPTTALPAWANVNPSTCEISGTPNNPLAITSYTLAATNGGGSSPEVTVSLKVDPGIPSLSYSGASGTTGTINQAMSVSPFNLNNNGAAITACGVKSGSTNAFNFPGTLSVNPSTCVISGTPTATLSSTLFTFVATNSVGDSLETSFPLAVNATIPSFSYLSATGTTGSVGQPMSVSPTALNTNGASITACGIKAGSANAGSFPGTLSVNASTCMISGTPTATLSPTSFTFVATNSVGNSLNTADTTVTLSIQAGVPSLSYSGASGTTGAVNQALLVSPTTLANFGAAITACQIKASTPALPSWASVNASTCVISGTPLATLSSTSYTFIATNNAGDSSPAVVALMVGAGVPTLSYSGASGSTGSVNQAMSVSPTTLNDNGASITACGIKAGSTNAGSFPGSLAVNASTCVISGTPTASLASTAFTLMATNSIGNSTEVPVTLTVNAASPVLSYSGSTGTAGTASQLMTVAPTTLTTNGASVTACGIKSGSTNAGSFPGTLSVNASTCVISGTPTSALSSTAFTLVATNSAGTSSNAVVTLSIGAGVPDFSFSGSSETTGSINHALSVSPTSLHSNGASITACGIKTGSTNEGSFPGTLSVNASTCVISGTPTALLSATSFTLVASNSVGDSTDTVVTLTIGVGGVPLLSYSGATGTTGTVNQAMSVAPTNLVNNGTSITACDVKASTTALPAWASVNSSTCVISGTPTGTLSSTSYTLIATNSSGNSTDATVSLVVNAGIPSLSYSGTSGNTGTVNQAMSVSPPTLNTNGASVTACGIKSGSTNAGSFPGTLSVNASTCVISGTPTATLSATSFTFIATNSAGNSSDASVTLTVGAGVPSLSYSGASGTTGAVNQAMSVTPTTLNANGASITACGIKAGSTNAGSFPGTLSVNASTCVISGTPTANLSATVFTLVATNSAGDSSNASVTLTVGAGVPSLSYSGASGTTGTVNQVLSVSPTTLTMNGSSVTACGIKAGSTNAGSFPGTLSVNASTCVISGTPTATLSSTAFTLVATNSAGDSSNAAVSLAITAGIPSLSYSGATGTTGSVNQAMSVSPTTLTTNGASITACDIRVPTTALPAWASVNSSTCVISGTPTGTLSSTSYTLVATNSAGSSSDATVSLVVNAAVPSLSYSGASGTTGTVNQAMSVSPTTLNANGASVTACGIKSGSTNEGSFPGTLSVNASTCVISGTPTANLSATAFTLVATNSAGDSSVAAVSLTIGAGVPSLSYSGASGTTGAVNSALSVSPTTLNVNGSSVTACGIKSGSTNAGSFPGTLSIDASTCVISGTPTATLSSTAFTLVATSSIGNSSDAVVTLAVNSAVPTLSYSGASGNAGTVNQAVSVSPTTLNANGASITACGIKAGSTNAGSFPGTLSINASTCVISGTPTATLSSTAFTFVATNSAGDSSNATLSLSVAAAVPSFSYSGSSETTGGVNQAMSVSPTTLNANGASITACGIKVGSTNAGSFPGTLSVNASTCVISGTPTALLSTTSFTLVASNSVGDSTDTVVALTVGAGGVPLLSYSGATGTTGTVNQAMSVSPTNLVNNGTSITACDVKASTTALPAWASVNASTCVISGTPTGTLSSTSYTFIATTSVGNSADATVSLTVNAGVPSLSYSGASGTTGTVNQALSVTPTTLTANGASVTACGIKSGSTNAGSFPGTLSVNASTCVISGTPTAVLSSTSFTLVATNSAGDSSTAAVSLSIGADVPSLSYSGASGTTGTINQVISVSPTTLTANGASITACGIKAGSTNAGSFPGTFSVNSSTCVISGTPTATLSATSFTLIATNSVGDSSNAAVSLTVGPGVPTLSYSGSSGTTGAVNQVMSVSPTTLSANGASVTACGIKAGSTNEGSFPGTLSVNASTCVISGTPAATLSATAFTLVATNSAGDSSNAAVTLTIGAGVPSLSYSGATGTTGTVNQSMSISPTTLTAHGASITACDIRVPTAALPAWASVNASTCVISGTPTGTLSSTSYTLVATNSAGNSSDATISLVVNAGAPNLSYSGATGTTGSISQSMSVSPTTLTDNGASVTACGIKSGSTNEGSFPGTLSVNASTCVISGTPSATLSATAFTLVATNSVGVSSDATVSLTIGAGVPNLSYSGSSGTTGTMNQAMSVSPTTLSENGASVTACGIKSGSTNAGSFPGTLSVDASTCVISGTPTVALSATAFTFVATNSAGNSANASVTLTISALAPTLSYSGATGTTGTAGQAMSVSPTTLTNNGASVTECGIKVGSTNAGSFPGTLSVNASTCVISGTPTTNLASTAFTLVATNSVGTSSDASVTLSINAAVPSLSYSGASGTASATNQALSVSPTTLANNGASVTACGIKAGSTNAGSFPGTLSVNASTCVISGTPTVALSATAFTLVATNSVGVSSDASVTLSVASPPTLSYSGATGTSRKVNQAVTVTPTTLNANGSTITACGIKAGSTNASSFPATLSVDSSTCVISGTPLATLSATAFTLVAANAGGDSSNATVTLTITPGVPTLSYTGATGRTINFGQSMSVSPTSIAENGAVITSCGIKSGSNNEGSFPAGLSVDASTCVISGTPSVAISATAFTMVAKNTGGTSSNAAVTLTVTAGVPSLSYAGASGTAGMMYSPLTVTPTSLVTNGTAVTSCGIKSGSNNAGSFPGTLSVNASTCVISGTPTAVLSATDFTFVAQHSGGTSSNATLSLSVIAAVPTLAYSEYLGSTINVPVSISPSSLSGNGASITACGIKSGSNNAGSFPGTLSVNASTCVISGTPTALLPFTSFTLVATNSSGDSSDAVTTFTVGTGVPLLGYSGSDYVRTTNQVVTITPTIFVPNGSAVTACGIKPGSSYEGSFPGTLSVNASTCVISGTPTSALSSTPFTLVASNSYGDSASAVVSIEIRDLSTLAQQAYIKASNVHTGDKFGLSAAISGDTLVVGAHQEDSNQSTITNGSTASTNLSAADSGAVYIFVRSGTSWTQQAYIKAPNNYANNILGYNVAISGDTVVVGAPWEASNQASITNGTTASLNRSSSYSGAAYIFARSGTTWSQQAYVKPANTYPSTGYAHNVAISGDTVAVGDSYEKGNQSTITNGTTASQSFLGNDLGAVYVYVRSGTTWSQQAYIKAPNNASGTTIRLGRSLGISGDTLAVGADGESSNQSTITNGSTASSDKSLTNAGAVYIFTRSGVNWSQQAYIKPPVVYSNQSFGLSVALSGDTVVASATDTSNQSTITNGSTASTDTSLSGAGAVFVFTRSGTTWSQQAYIKPSNPTASASFGVSPDGAALALSADTLVVGAPGDKSNQSTITIGSTASSNTSASGSGAAYIFTRSGTNWSQQAYIKAPNVLANAAFGYSVSISNGTIVMGSPNESSSQSTITNGTTASLNASQSSSGAVYVFTP